MGKFACYCGHVISDSTYPCPQSGRLQWEPELDWQDAEVRRVVAEFLAAVESDGKDDWIRNYFGEDYPQDLSSAENIEDIYSKVSDVKTRLVLQCPECERLYLQKEYDTNEWTCFEKRN